eukprot:TRINITY_DN15567_c0_g1_i1.p1 TRINITY_DN15567_c0_g1~~TRINITY_DN15567_c0_g1_i1.p1  ORF type:complete len:1180 (-),score=311.31 TRINITY_DN15567_c0_g1_i1:65-3577(-)
MATIPQLLHRAIFGSKPSVNCYFKDEHSFVYAAGDAVIIYAFDTKVQQVVIPTEKSAGITALCCSPSRRYVAVAEKSDRGIISIYDLVSLRRRRTLTSSECGSQRYVSCCFSSDNKLFLAQGGEPDWRLVIWNWEKMKVLATITLNVPMHQCSFNPGDPTVICATGDGIFRIYRFADNVFKQVVGAVAKRDPQKYLSHEWLSDERLIVGTDNGDLLLFENNEFKMALPQSPADGNSIESFAGYSRGFVCAGDNGIVHLFEKTDDAREAYRRTKTFKIHQNAVPVTTLAISPSEEVLVCGLDNSQLFSLNLSSTDLMKPDDMNFEYLFQSFHHGAVTGLDVCVRKPLIATCGLDRTVRIWNYVDRTLELSQTFNEDIHSIAFHPTGHYVLVGFGDKLRLMNLLIDDIRPFKEFNIKQCKECRFSNGGQFFAAVNNNTIQIFNFYTFENHGNLRGHNGKVQSLYWVPDDAFLISAGQEGAVYKWRFSTLKREDETVVKGCQYTSAVCTPDYKTIIACGNDKKIKQIAENAVQVSYDHPVCVTQLTISRSGKQLFAGTEQGTIRAYKFPLTGEFLEYNCHAAAVSRLIVSPDDALLFSVGEDGTVALFDIKDKEARGPKRDKEDDYSREILVTKSDLEDKTNKLVELEAKVSELTTQNEYSLKLKEIGHQEELKKLEDEHQNLLQAQRIQYELLQQEKTDKENEFGDRSTQAEERHKQKLLQIDGQFQQKIMKEVEAYRRLAQEKELLNERWEEQHKLLVDNHERMIAEMTDEYETRLNEDQLYIEQLNQEKDELIREFEETKRQLEEDADAEIEELKDEYERKLASERETGMKAKTDLTGLQKKWNAQQKDIDDQKDEIRLLHEKEKELYALIANYEKEKTALAKEIKEREETIGDKEKRIFELKKKNQELEKFKFVLDYKIKELKKQIEPREIEIADMKEQIKDMDSDLVRYHKTKSNLELDKADLKMKVDSLQHEVLAERRKVTEVEALLRRIRTDLHETVQHIQDPKALKESVRLLYQKHVNITVKEHGLDVDIQREYNRQREYLERSVASLKTKLGKETDRHKKENIRIMQENVQLIREINDLRREIKLMKQAQRQKEMLGPGKTHEGLIDSSWPPEAIRALEMQREEIQRVKSRLEEIEANPSMLKRPISRERLPPLDGVHSTDDDQ